MRPHVLKWRMVSRSLIAHMVVAAVAAGLILIGLLIATRLVGDESLRAHATAKTGQGTVSALRNSWDGSQLITVIWSDTDAYQKLHVNWSATPKVYTSSFEVFASPRYSVGDTVDVAFNRQHPAVGAVLADPNLSEDPDLRADSVMQSLIPFALAGIVLTLLVIWPVRRSPVFNDYSLVSLRKGLYWYVLTPCIACAVAVAIPIAMQHLVADSVLVDVVSLLVVGLISWPVVRAVRYRRLELLLTTTQDAVDLDAIVTSVDGRRLQVDTNSGEGAIADGQYGRIDVIALRGQSGQLFAAGDRVRFYGRWRTRGPILVAAGVAGYEKLLIGFGRRRVADLQGSHSYAGSRESSA